MSQTTTTAAQMITRAMQQLGELGSGETADSFMLETGLYLLNQLLNSFSANPVLCPYILTLTFNLVPGQNDYILSNVTLPIDVLSNRMVSLTYANFSLLGSANIIYPLTIISKTQFYTLTRISNLQALPAYIFLNKQNEESILTIYPAPDQPYPLTIQGKFMIDQLTTFESIIQVPLYYEDFLRYALCRRMKSFYPSSNWDKESEDEYQRLFASLLSSNEVDMTIRPSNILTRSQNGFYWQTILSYAS